MIEMKKDIKLKLVGCGGIEERFVRDFVFSILSKKYNIIEADNPDYLFCGPKGIDYLYYDCIKIFITGEVLIPNWNIFDYGISYEYMLYGDRHLRYPFSFWNEKHYRLAREKHKNIISDRNKFCSCMVSVPSKDSPRDEFFKKLCEYKKVDSGGRHLNNIGGGYIADKLGWLKDYKFHICFENAASVGYFTEKMVDAWAAGCVPIYWGDISLKRTEMIPDVLSEYKINPKSYINVHDYNSFDEAIEEIKRIDNDNEAYLSMLKEPVFLDDVDWYDYYQSKLEKFILSIVDVNIQNAKRKESTHFIRRYMRNNFHVINVGYLQEKIRRFKKRLKK